jgi:hypothetical protein
MKDWTTMMKPTLKTTLAATKAQTALTRKIFRQLKGKTKMKEIKAKTDQEKEKCQQLLRQDYFAKEMNFKKI